MRASQAKRKASGTSGSTTASEAPPDGFEEALSAAAADPNDDSPWQRLEDAVDSEQSAARLLRAYRNKLTGELPAAVRERLARRTVHFAAECFGENASEVIALAKQVLAVMPQAEWAFEHVTAAFTTNARWPELLDVLETRLAATTEPARRRALLAELAHIAKDLAGDHSRAAGYLEQLLVLDPGDAETAAALERLLERQERWAVLVELWKRRLAVVSPTQARALRGRIAVMLYERLAQPQAALTELRALAPDEVKDGPLLALLERVLRDEGAPDEARLEALAQLRAALEASGAAARLTELVPVALGFAGGPALRGLRRELGERLFAAGDGAGALEQYAALLALEPEDREVEQRLRQLADAAGDAAGLARALRAAAEACPAGGRRVQLHIAAAEVQDRSLANHGEAAALFELALGQEEASPETRRQVLRRLDQLYAALENGPRQLHTLERLASSEPDRGEQRLVWARAAARAAALGDTDRALAAWQARLLQDPADAEALAASLQLLAGAERWQQVSELLHRRIATQPAAHQIRADLVQIARVARDRLGNLARAIDTWQEVSARFGEDAECVEALAELFAAAGRFQELAELLARRVGQDGVGHAAMLAKLGDTLRERLQQPAEALACYARALDVDAAHEAARAGLGALLAERELAAQAAEPLARAAERTDSWQLLLELLPHRLAGAATPSRRAGLLREAAAIARQRADDGARAYRWLCQALPLAPADLALADELQQLAEATGDFTPAVQALGEASAVEAVPAPVRAHLAEQRAGLLERRLQDLAGASDSYALALALCPQRLELREGLIRTAAGSGRWTGAAAALADAAVAANVRQTTLLPLYESLANETGGHRAAADALAGELGRAAGLEPSVRRDLELWLARLLVERCSDPAAAEAALVRASALDEGHVPTLLLRADLQRRQPGRALYDTLAMLARQAPDNLDHQREAAELALTDLGDEGRALEALERLWQESRRRLRAGQGASGQHQPADAAHYALEQMVERHAAARTAARTGQAVSLLLEGAALPLPDSQRQQWLRRAAELAEAGLPERQLAIDLWSRLHDQTPEESAPREALARLLEGEQHYERAVAVRVAELGHSQDPGQRLAARLEIVRLSALFERKVSPVEVLRANLAERPGHTASLRGLSELLTRQGRTAELADVLEQQARLLEEQGGGAGAAAVWTQLAALAEQPLARSDRATAAWERVAALEPSTSALDALARLKLAGGDAVSAAAWLERRLSMTEGEPRIEVTVRLAQAYQAAGQRHRVIACLDRTLTEFPAAEQLRGMLVELYRGAEAWEPLARVLAEGCAYLNEESAWVARARSAVELYTRLGMLARAVPLLEKLVPLHPRDEGFRSALAEGLAQCGRRQEARTLLLALIADAGWKRSRKRAGLHHRLAEVARADGDLAVALEHLEQALSMDVSSREILQQLAEVAEASGADERAERAYRALMVLRRQNTPAPAEGKTESAGGGLTVSEILLRLHDLAGKRGQAAESAELIDSALTAATVDAAEAERLQRALLERGKHDLLDRLFDKRLLTVAGPAAAAEVHAQRATCLRALGRGPEALEALVRAVEAAPGRADLQAAAVEQARGEGQIPALLQRLLAVVDGLRRRQDAPVAAALLLRAARLAESDLHDLDRALALCRRAEDGSQEPLEVWDTLARIAGKRGDVAECDRLIGLLKHSAAAAGSPQAAADALYRAAALELARAETRAAGIASLCQAVEGDHDLQRAMDLVVAVGLPQADLVNILPLYERVARQSGDERMLLDYLERRCAAPSVTVAEAREAVDLAVALGRADRVEPLLLRLADVAAEAEADKEASWALLELVQRKKGAGELAGAAQVLERLADRLEAERVLSLTRELAERATRAGDLPLAVQLLERLRARGPVDESVWRALLQHYIELREGESLDRLVSETLPMLVAPDMRNELRLARARYLLAGDERNPAAVECLRDMLLEEPDHGEALLLLTACYERTGADGELCDLLEQRFEVAAEQRDRDGVRDIALRLGEVLERTDAHRAVALYERALRLLPGQRDLLRRLLARTPADQISAEQAPLMEELLAPDAGAEAARLAQDLADIWTRLGDQQAVRRVLEKGWRLAPDEALAERLEHWYRAHDAWGPLAELLVGEAERQSDAQEAAALLREAASLHSGRLNDAEAALALLARARQRAPEDGELVIELMRALQANGNLEGAMAELAAVLGDAFLPADRRLSLLLLRAEIDQARKDRRAAVATLQEAYAVDPEAAYQPLAAALSAWQDEAAMAADTAGLQDATLALVRLQHQRGALSEARETIEPLLHSAAADARIVRLAGELAEAAGDLEAALAAAVKLVPRAPEGERFAAAERTAELAARLGRPAEAASSLEAALAANPGHPRLVELLSALYERSGQLDKLARLLFEQARHSADEAERFQHLGRAGELFLQAGAAPEAVAALTDALSLRPTDHKTTLLLSEAHLASGALQEAAAPLKPLITSHKGKASPALAALYAQVARIAAQAGDLKSELQALSRALDADRKNGTLAAQLADRAEAVGDDELVIKALRTITVHPGNGPITVPMALLRQARLAQRRGDANRAILFARQAVQEAGQGDPIAGESREFLKSLGAS